MSLLSAITITHTDVWIAIAALVVVPTWLILKVKRIPIGGSFVSDHWGDSVGLFLILLGVTVDMISPLYKDSISIMSVFAMGNGLITAGGIALKLKTVPDSSAANGGTRTTETHTQETVPVPPGPPGKTVVVETASTIQSPTDAPKEKI